MYIYLPRITPRSCGFTGTPTYQRPVWVMLIVVADHQLFVHQLCIACGENSSLSLAAGPLASLNSSRTMPKKTNLPSLITMARINKVCYQCEGVTNATFPSVDRDFRINQKGAPTLNGSPVYSCYMLVQAEAIWLCTEYPKCVASW